MAEEKKKGAKPSAEQIAARKAAKAKSQKVETEAADEAPAQPAPPPRLIAHYREKVVPQLQQKFGYQNLFAVPRLEKIVISMGLGKAVTGGEKGKLEQAEKELTIIAGQKPVRCKAKKSVANFKVREGMETGLKVTLRGTRMYEFLDRLINTALPRVRDFRGVPHKSFDGRGNYALGLKEQIVFPEINYDKIDQIRGMDIIICSTAKTDEEAKALLAAMNMPFVK